MSELYNTPCGQDCRECSFFGKDCKGCMNAEGLPFWGSHVGMPVCPIYDCAANQKALDHCGNCADYPCKTYLDLRDPAMSDDQWQKSLDDRKENLMGRKGR